MFKSAFVFNQDISEWDVASVGANKMLDMFYDTRSFNFRTSLDTKWLIQNALAYTSASMYALSCSSYNDCGICSRKRRNPDLSVTCSNDYEAPSTKICTYCADNSDECCLIICPAGQYSDAATNTCYNMSNSTCPVGQGFESVTATNQATFRGSTENDGICTLCVPGQHKSTMLPSSCSVCPPGTYQNNSGSGSCIKCPKGTNLKLAGAAVDHDSLVDCQECDTFQFNPFEGHAEDCYMCLTAINPGSIQCDGCYPGQYPVVDVVLFVAVVVRFF